MKEIAIEKNANPAMPVAKKLRARITQRVALVGASLSLFGAEVMAQALPTTAPPTRGGAAGNYIEMMQNYAYDIFIFLGLAVATVAFFAVTKNTIGAYGEVQDGKGTWGQVGMQFGVGVLLLVFVVFLLTEAAAIL